MVGRHQGDRDLSDTGSDRRIDQLHVSGLAYHVGVDDTVAIWFHDGLSETHTVGPTAKLASAVAELREELTDTTQVASGHTPRLSAFSSDWGLRLLPPSLSEATTDVVVVIPHNFLHSVPIHLIAPPGSSLPLGCRVGVSYTSSASLFVRCSQRNQSRGIDPSKWTFNPSDPAGRDVTNSPAIGARRVLAGGVDVTAAGVDSFQALAVDVLERTRSAVEMQSGADPDPLSRFDLKIVLSVPGAPYGLICLAAHGFIDRHDHEMSGLLLGVNPFMTKDKSLRISGKEFYCSDEPLRDVPPNLGGRTDAEVMTIAELESDGECGAELVALMGCSAGLADLLQADEPASLAETFLHIGCGSVIAPMWDSYYDATRVWMSAFLDAWLLGRFPKAIAAKHAFKSCMDQVGHLGIAGPLTLRGDWL